MGTMKIGGLELDTPGDYEPRMVVIAAPMKQAAAMGGQMAIKAQTNFARNFVVATEALPKDFDLEEYVGAQMQLMKQSMPDFKVLKQATTTVGGKEVPLIETQAPGPEGRLIMTLNAYVQKGNTVFTLSGSHLAGLPFQDTKKEYLAMIQSFSTGE